MSKKIFVLIVLLMSISLIGIIAVQIFWIKSSIEIREKQFKSDVTFALINVSDNLKKRELNDYYKNFIVPLKETQKSATDTEISNFLYQQVDTSRNERFTYSQSILEENYKIPLEVLEKDSVILKNIYSRKDIQIVKLKTNNEDLTNAEPDIHYQTFSKLDDLEKYNIEEIINAIASRVPIHHRINSNELQLSIENELLKRNVETDFKFGIYSNGLATKVKSGYFTKDESKSYMVPMFADKYGNSNYQLFVSFPEKQNFIISSIYKILLLSVFFIIVIIIAFVSSLYQLIKQKQISEIKTDFINNMTHEFKTPIATINLALDAIKNPKIIDDKEKVRRYVKMIREENKRMHAQVENVLRISKLEKNQLDVSKETVDIHDLLDDAVTHVKLLINSKEGYIKKHFKAELSEVLANSFHITSIFVNMFDNAIKYTENEPKIDIYTESTAKNIIIKIKDQGIGMNKNVQKNIFKKFYREETGNIHNVKGHGLGLSYVKKIVEIHQGSIHVESEKGKGSTFIIELPLI